MGNSEFKPTRRELADVRRFAKECEGHADLARYCNGQRLPLTARRMSAFASDFSDLAFRLSQRVAARGQAQ